MILLHLLPIVVVIAAVTAALKDDAIEKFPREFLRTAGTMLAGFVGLGIVIFVIGRLL